MVPIIPVSHFQSPPIYIRLTACATGYTAAAHGLHSCKTIVPFLSFAQWAYYQTQDPLCSPSLSMPLTTMPRPIYKWRTHEISLHIWKIWNTILSNNYSNLFLWLCVAVPVDIRLRLVSMEFIGQSECYRAILYREPAKPVQATTVTLYDDRTGILKQQVTRQCRVAWLGPACSPYLTRLAERLKTPVAGRRPHSCMAAAFKFSS